MTQDYSTGAAPPPFRPENESASVLRGRVAQLVTDLAVQLHTAESAQATQARQRERIETLTGITKQLLSATALEEVLEAVVESASRLCDASGALVMLIDPDGPSLRPRAVHGALVGLSRLVERGELITDTYLSATALGQAISQRSVVVIEDYATSSVSPERRARALAMGVRAFIIAPLLVGGTPIGVLLVGDPTPRTFAPEDVALVQALADQVALAIEQARLYEQQRQTAQELATLLQVSHVVSSTLDLDQLLDVILDQIKVVVDYDGAVISMLEDDMLHVLRRRAPPPSAPAPSKWDVAMRREGAAATGLDRTLRREVVIIDDVQGEEPLAQSWRAALDVPLEQSPGHYVRAWMSVPLVLPDRVFGRITLSSTVPHAYTDHHAQLVTGFATQAAAAIENARLYGQARKVAALEERQRLSRELHDSVSQALFGIGLGARTARTLLERQEAEKALGSVDYVVSLAEAGMAEMRALLFELRPESLATEGLVVALTKHAAVLRLRHELVVEMSQCEEPDVSLETKEALYRIAQEALHNIVKHAKAHTVALVLVCDAGGIALSVRDDGVGFDTSGAFPGHIGQHSMRERAARLGGSVTVASAPGEGTCVHVLIPSKRA